ncbi:hypothetical protein [Sphingobacterium chuzhouense]|uniref:Lipocalin-like domain-containing protein n=1 Tax=Sphingobacterium chuzhouense TaxID=1742264 RepID=A0ABR7XMQ2_9SPHI|nr:hypothetical protein [Sphingobacterium chuzhouense]MBD1420444.1 hypothetical protein [Sphingobacterium chuzhouense]
MNKTINIHLIILLLLSGTVLFSCKKEKAVPLQALELDKNSIEILEGYASTIEVKSGNGNYTVSETSLVEIEIDGNTITFTATENYGEERLFILDGTGRKAALDIKVIPAVLDADDPRFYWDGLIELEQANEWSTTILENKIAMTNVAERKQLVLSWNGEFAVGLKPRATLRIVDDGDKRDIALTKLEILAIDRSKNLCTMVFYKEKQKGELVFVLP